MHPAHDCRRVYFDATFLHPLRKITVANAVLAVPTDTKQKALNRKAPTLEHGPSYRRSACEMRKHELMQQSPRSDAEANPGCTLGPYPVRNHKAQPVAMSFGQGLEQREPVYPALM